jgi:DNA-binding transcriptional ArsR family regulator
MVQYLNSASRAAADKFSALADPARMAMVEQLGRGGASITELASSTGITLTGARKHVRVLEEAELVVTDKRGRTRWCELSYEGFDEAAFWLDEFRRRRHQQLNRLENLIDKHKQEEKG